MNMLTITPKKRKPGPQRAEDFRKNAKQNEADRIIAGGASNVLLYGGARSGKTFHGVGTVLMRAMLAPGSRHAIVRQHLAHVIASVWRDTLPKVCRLRFPKVKFHWDNSNFILRLANGSEIYLLGLDDANRAEKILGMEFATLYFNEITQISYNSILLALTRLAQSVDLPVELGRGLKGWKPRHAKLPLLALYDCNPPRKQHYSYKIFHEGVDPVTGAPIEDFKTSYAALQINLEDNRANVHPDYYKRAENMPPAMRKRFFLGEYSDGVEGALWDWSHFIRPREEDLPDYRRIVIGVDPPAGGQGTFASECGIIVAARGADARGYILEDRSLTGGVEKWARVVRSAYYGYLNQGYNVTVVGEINNGGDMVEKVIRGEDKAMKVVTVRASKGKAKRAEPISLLYHNDMMRHCGHFGDLENQMVEITPDFDPELMGYSPDRVDALVWACSELMLGSANAVNTAKVIGA